MKKQWLMLGVVLVSLLVSPVLAGCGASPASSYAVVSPDSPAAVSNPVAGPAPDKAPGEAVKVHGRWTIEVTNPDGTLAERREFDNALETLGSQLLARLLSRGNSVGGWIVRLAGDPKAFGAPGSPTDAVLVESTSPLDTSASIFKTLTVSVPTSGANAGKFVLRGTATASNDGNIGRVSTSVVWLSPTLPPSSSYPSMDLNFSHQYIAPLALSAGQGVTVTVVFSFS